MLFVQSPFFISFQYLEQTLAQMTEAWEDILLEMDSKLAKFADDKRVSEWITIKKAGMKIFSKFS